MNVQRSRITLLTGALALTAGLIARPWAWARSPARPPVTVHADPT